MGLDFIVKKCLNILLRNKQDLGETVIYGIHLCLFFSIDCFPEQLDTLRGLCNQLKAASKQIKEGRFSLLRSSIAGRYEIKKSLEEALILGQGFYQPVSKYVVNQYLEVDSFDKLVVVIQFSQRDGSQKLRRLAEECLGLVHLRGGSGHALEYHRLPDGVHDVQLEGDPTGFVYEPYNSDNGWSLDLDQLGSAEDN